MGDKGIELVSITHNGDMRAKPCKQPRDRAPDAAGRRPLSHQAMEVH
jgi:hypothetical protein